MSGDGKPAVRVSSFKRGSCSGQGVGEALCHFELLPTCGRNDSSGEQGEDLRRGRAATGRVGSLMPMAQQ